MEAEWRILAQGIAKICCFCLTNIEAKNMVKQNWGAVYYTSYQGNRFMKTDDLGILKRGSGDKSKNWS